MLESHFPKWNLLFCLLQTMQTNLTGEESLEADDVGCGLEGAENIGQEGERGEVGLGDVALRRKFTQTDAIASCKGSTNHICPAQV